MVAPPKRDTSATVVQAVVGYTIVASISLLVYGYGLFSVNAFQSTQSNHVFLSLSCGLSMGLATIGAVAVAWFALVSAPVWAGRCAALSVALLWAVVVTVNVVFLVLYFTDHK